MKWFKHAADCMDDPTLAYLSDNLWRRYFELYALASQIHEGGILPKADVCALKLRVNPKTLRDEMQQLALQDLVRLESVNGSDVWVITRYADEQSRTVDADTALERRRASDRERQARRRAAARKKKAELESLKKKEKEEDKDIDVDIDVGNVIITLPSRDRHVTHNNDDDRDAVEDAVERVCHIGKTASPSIVRRASEAAKTLHEAGYTAQQILDGFEGHQCYWYQAGHGSKNYQPPQPGNIKNDIEKAIRWQSPTVSSDDLDAIWEIVKRCARGDAASIAKMRSNAPLFDAYKTSRVRDKLRANGSASRIDFIRREFEGEYQKNAKRTVTA